MARQESTGPSPSQSVPMFGARLSQIVYGVAKEHARSGLVESCRMVGNSTAGKRALEAPAVLECACERVRAAESQDFGCPSNSEDTHLAPRELQTDPKKMSTKSMPNHSGTNRRSRRSRGRCKAGRWPSRWGTRSLLKNIHHTMSVQAINAGMRPRAPTSVRTLWRFAPYTCR